MKIVNDTLAFPTISVVDEVVALWNVTLGITNINRILLSNIWHKQQTLDLKKPERIVKTGNIQAVDVCYSYFIDLGGIFCF